MVVDWRNTGRRVCEYVSMLVDVGGGISFRLVLRGDRNP